MRGASRLVYQQEKESSSGKTEMFMREILLMAKKQEKERSVIKTETVVVGNGLMI